MGKCAKRGCPMESWNGQVGEYCSWAHKLSAGVKRKNWLKPNTTCMCKTLGCNRPTWNRQPGYCSMAHLNAAKLSQPATVSLRWVANGSEGIEAFFQRSWDAKSVGPAPGIKSVWEIHSAPAQQMFLAYCAAIGNVRTTGLGVNPGNQHMLFHRTSMFCRATFNGQLCKNGLCKACSIMANGFLLKFCTQNPTWKHYGIGLYTSPSSSYGVALATQKISGGVTIVCSVACGNIDETDTTAPLQRGKHSRKGASTTRLPSDEELVVFDQRAIIPRYLILC